MNTETHSNTNYSAKLPTQSKSANGAVKSIESKIPSIAGISLPEIAVLGAAGYVLWRNRSKVQSFLEQNGIEVPAILSGDFSDLLQKGAKSLGAKDTQKDNQAGRSGNTGAGNDSMRRHDA